MTNYWQNLPNAGGLAGMYGLQPQAGVQSTLGPQGQSATGNPLQMLMQLLGKGGQGGAAGGGGGGYDQFAGARQIGKGSGDLIRSLATLI